MQSMMLLVDHDQISFGIVFLMEKNYMITSLSVLYVMVTKVTSKKGTKVFPVDILHQMDAADFNDMASKSGQFSVDTASSVAKTISSQSPIKIRIPGSSGQCWLLTTYLDREIRISRDDGGSVFVLIKAARV
ncbi:hypothetical protein KSP40_PGU004357 [Platanthera guangdongensis]|uniref:Plastid lipid-associated protein/fibrillin conserved domain-containing protein n=1 Tax=Platanthera guangdongensis TaxID=2320717 RepID=A0ABR2MPD3_9ASPA